MDQPPLPSTLFALMLLGSWSVEALTLQEQARLANPPTAISQQLSLLSHRLRTYARQTEKLALERGLPLDADGLDIARQMGVSQPEAVRVWYTESLPLPSDPELKALAQQYEMDAPDLVGFTYGHGIFIRSAFAGDRSLLAHELVHVSQYERLGFDDFVHRYLLELMLLGYRRAPLEVEAYNRMTQLK